MNYGLCHNGRSEDFCSHCWRECGCNCFGDDGVNYFGCYFVDGFGLDEVDCGRVIDSLSLDEVHGLRCRVVDSGGGRLDHVDCFGGDVIDGLSLD